MRIFFSPSALPSLLREPIRNLYQLCLFTREYMHLIIQISIAMFPWHTSQNPIGSVFIALFLFTDTTETTTTAPASFPFIPTVLGAISVIVFLLMVIFIGIAIYNYCFGSTSSAAASAMRRSSSTRSILPRGRYWYPRYYFPDQQTAYANSYSVSTSLGEWLIDLSLSI